MNTAYIYDYWNRTELGRRMIESKLVSESDLLFLMPNNVKKMHGLPVTRVLSRRKSKFKKRYKRNILGFQLYKLMEDTMEELLPRRIDSFIEKMVDVSNSIFD